MTDRPTVLVPVRVLEGESIPDGVPELLASANVVLLGYHVVPEQTAPGQARMQFEKRALNRLEEFETILENEGATVETRLVFTQDGQKTIDRMIYEHDCLAVLVPKATSTVDNVLVAVRGTVGVDRLARLLSGLFAGTNTGITLYHATGENESEEDARTLLEGIAGRLIDGGLDSAAIETRIEAADRALAAIVEQADDFDAVVMGESNPSVATFIFGMPAAKLAEQFLGPVLVVQRERPEDDEADSEQTDAEQKAETPVDTAGTENEPDS